MALYIKEEIKEELVSEEWYPGSNNTMFSLEHEELIIKDEQIPLDDNMSDSGFLETDGAVELRSEKRSKEKQASEEVDDESYLCQEKEVTTPSNIQPSFVHQSGDESVDHRDNFSLFMDAGKLACIRICKFTGDEMQGKSMERTPHQSHSLKDPQEILINEEFVNNDEGKSVKEAPTEVVNPANQYVCCICHENKEISHDSFRTRMPLICDICYDNLKIKSKSVWMDKKHELYRSCVGCQNVVDNSFDFCVHNCTCANLFWCACCQVCFNERDDIIRHASVCCTNCVGVSNNKLEGSSSTNLSVLPRNKRDFLNNKERIKRQHKCMRISNKNSIEKCVVNWKINYMCKDCKAIFKTPYLLRQHLKVHAEELPYCCKLCEKRFSQSSSLENHLQTHTENKPFTCTYCEKGFTQSHHFKVHLLTHTKEKSLICEYCSKGFSDSSSLKKHVQTHTGERPFTCKDCSRAFSDSSGLRRHLRTHTGEKPFLCKFCKKEFARSYTLLIHLQIHRGEKPFICKYCNKGFCDSSSLKKHVRSHTGEKPFICDYCKKDFYLSHHLQAHLRTHTGEKPFICMYCKKGFSVHNSLQKHLLTHKREKSFVCKYCEKSFSRSDHLQSHLRIHSGEKLFICKYCKKGFTFSSSLKRHMRTHTGEKQFICKFCNKGFAQSCHLKAHFVTHSEENIDL